VKLGSAHFVSVFIFEVVGMLDNFGDFLDDEVLVSLYVN
jgi:hypothetical protein